MSSNIKYIPHRDIDLFKWDECIDGADNGLIYAKSFYLDIMAAGWDALVLNDYEYVMPLTWNRKYGFYYLYQPYFVPSLGVFGKNIQPVTALDFLHSVPKKLKYWDIDLNEANNFTGKPANLKLNISTRVNYHLGLEKPYEAINASYKELCCRKLKHAVKQQVQVVTNGQPAEVIEFYRRHYERKHPGILPAVYDSLIVSTTKCFEKNQAKVYQAILPGGEITAAYLVLLDKNFVYFLIGGSSEKGKQTGSFYLVTDAAIKDHAGSGKTFRFEGSDIPGVAFFNAQFGAIISHYLHVNKNDLPFPLNLLKRLM